MKKKLNVHFSENITPPQRVTIKQIIRAGMGTDGCEISISFVTPEEIQKLNNQYRKKNKPTDVLSFPPSDIIICPEIAQAQATEYGHTLERELAFLTAHGLLHLLGHDHETPEDEAKMISAQKEILEKVGINR